MNSNKILEVEHVNKSFYLSKKEKLKAVNDVSFSLYENETLGIVGESGCGKTTLARLIVSLYEVDEGKIIFNNKIINKNYYSNELKKLKKSKLDKKKFLIEKEKTLGGLARQISQIPEKTRIAHFPKYLEKRAEKLHDLF